MKKYIVIVYDPKTAVDDSSNYDLFDQLVRTMDLASVNAKAHEYSSAIRAAQALTK